MAVVDNEQLDAILGLQVSVAWAGETAGDSKRLGWWNTDLIDEAGGGDLLARLLPRTGAWAAFEMAREAAIRVDAEGRSRLARPDGATTLFHFGFEVDEALRDRLQHHKRHGHVASEALCATWGVLGRWNHDDFIRFLRAQGTAKVEDAPAGRRLPKTDASPDRLARLLAAALLPLAESYPLPFTEFPVSK